MSTTTKHFSTFTFTRALSHSSSPYAFSYKQTQSRSKTMTKVFVYRIHNVLSTLTNPKLPWNNITWNRCKSLQHTTQQLKKLIRFIWSYNNEWEHFKEHTVLAKCNALTPISCISATCEQLKADSPTHLIPLQFCRPIPVRNRASSNCILWWNHLPNCDFPCVNTNLQHVFGSNFKKVSEQVTGGMKDIDGDWYTMLPTFNTQVCVVMRWKHTIREHRSQGNRKVCVCVCVARNGRVAHGKRKNYKMWSQQCINVAGAGRWLIGWCPQYCSHWNTCK